MKLTAGKKEDRLRMLDISGWSQPLPSLDSAQRATPKISHLHLLKEYKQDSSSKTSLSPLLIKAKERIQNNPIVARIDGKIEALEEMLTLISGEKAGNKGAVERTLFSPKLSQG